jgi:beta-lactam-binding protein with PASTA domain
MPQQKKNIFAFITDRPLWLNILAGVALGFFLLAIFFGSLKWITGFGKQQKIPSVIGQNIVAAQKMLEDQGFTVEIQDSVYVDTVAKLSVLKQSPEADEMVKSGRTVYLTINRALPPLVDMPNLVGLSIRSAEMYLQTMGLKLGTVSYKPDIAKNAVLEQLVNDQVIKAGTKIPLGTVISFVLGSGLGGTEMDVPNLVGMNFPEARAYLQSAGINIGAIIAEGIVKDSASAFVVRQNPAVFTESVGTEKVINKIKQGQLMDIWISATAPVRDTTIQTTENQ